MYTRRMAGFWSSLVHVGKDMIGITAATVTGGPAAGAAAAVSDVAKANSGHKANGGTAAPQPSNFIAGLSNTNLAVIAASGAAILITLSGRRR